MKRYIRADADRMHNKLIFFLSTPKIKLLVPSVLQMQLVSQQNHGE